MTIKTGTYKEMQIDSALVYNGNSLIHVAERGKLLL